MQERERGNCVGNKCFVNDGQKDILGNEAAELQWKDLNWMHLKKKGI